MAAKRPAGRSFTVVGTRNYAQALSLAVAASVLLWGIAIQEARADAFSIACTGEGDSLGWSIAVDGDFNGDGTNDIIILGAEATGKLKMVLQSIGVHGLILHYSYFGINCYAVGMATLVASAIVGIWSAVQYHFQVFRAMTRTGSW